MEPDGIRHGCGVRQYAAGQPHFPRGLGLRRGRGDRVPVPDCGRLFPYREPPVSGRPDPATTLERAGERASEGRGDQAIALLTEEIRLSPQLWQAFQYRGELYLQQGDQVEAAVRDFSEAIRLAPQEPHLYGLRAYAYSLLGDESSSRSDYARADELAGETPRPAGQ